MKTFYIHGYGSSPKSQTFLDFADRINGIECLTYNHEFPMNSIGQMLETLMQVDGPVHIIASSLGGWYAEKIAEFMSGVSLTLYNPSLTPKKSLSKYNISKEILSRYQDLQINSHIGRTVILSVDDDVVPNDYALNTYSAIANVKLTKGGHRMTPENMEIIIDDWKFRKNQLG